MTQTKTRRWLQSAITEAARCTVAMPWQRGAERQGNITRRSTATGPKARIWRAVQRSA